MDNWQLVLNSLPAMLWGLRYTFLISISSFVLSMIFGAVVLAMWRSKSPILRAAGFVYVQVFRSLSPYVYILLIYFALAGITGWAMTPVTAAIISLTLLNTAYITEIYRGVFTAIDGGQWEAGMAAGLTGTQINLHIIWPQVFRLSIPLLLNQFIVILKDSAIVGVIGVKDILYVANAQATITYRQFEFLTVVALVFVVLVFMLSSLSRWLERRLAF